MLQQIKSNSAPLYYTEEEINKLVESFYTKARKDPELGPIFETYVTNWKAHFVQMTDFWSGNLLGTSRFHGAPMPKHLAIPDLRPELFEQWLKLFKQTTQELGNQTLELHANRLAYRIANRLWTAYQKQHYPDKPLRALHRI